MPLGIKHLKSGLDGTHLENVLKLSAHLTLTCMSPRPTQGDTHSHDGPLIVVSLFRIWWSCCFCCTCLEWICVVPGVLRHWLVFMFVFMSPT